MAIDFNKSGNPTLSDKIFQNATTINDGSTMNARRVLFKFGFLFLMALVSASLTWTLYYSGKSDTVTGLMWMGIIVGLILTFIMIFKPQYAAIIAPVYGLAEGFFLGGISAIANFAFEESYPGIVMQAVGLTFGVVIAMFLLYNFRIIKVTEKLRSVIIMATVGIGIFYLLSIILHLFNINMPFLYTGSTFGIIFSVVVVGIAALNLLLDFDRIEELSTRNAPKYMEWYCAFSLMVTIVWLYIEILRLLMKIASSRN